MPAKPVRSAKRLSLHNLSYAVTLGVFVLIIGIALLFGSQLQSLHALAQHSRTKAVPLAMAQHARATKVNHLRYVAETLASSIDESSRLQAIRDAEAIITVVLRNTPQDMQEPLQDIKTSFNRLNALVLARQRYEDRLQRTTRQADHLITTINGALDNVQQNAIREERIQTHFDAGQLKGVLLELRHRLSLLPSMQTAEQVEDEKNYYAGLLSPAATLAARLQGDDRAPAIDIALEEFEGWQELFTMRSKVLLGQYEADAMVRNINKRLSDMSLRSGKEAVDIANEAADTLASRMSSLLWIALLALIITGIGFLFLVAVARRDVIRPMTAASRAIRSLADNREMPPLADTHLQEVDEINLALQQLGEALRETDIANERSLRMVQAKNTFTSTVSHELRTPLTSMLGFARLVAKEFGRTFAPLAEGNPLLESKSKRIMDNLDIVGRESQRLANLVNDVLDIARMESGRVHWHEDTILLEELIYHTREAVSGALYDKPGVELTIAASSELPTVVADRDKLQQVLLNLLQNALKFTDRGVVGLTADSKQGELVIVVHDTGSGIRADDLPHIFEKFQQGSPTANVNNKPRGTGLGLAICKQIIEHYGGRISVESTVSKGSRFTIRLPLANLTSSYAREKAATIASKEGAPS